MNHNNPIDKVLCRKKYKNNLFLFNGNNMDMLVVAISMFIQKNNYNSILLTGRMDDNVQNYIVELKEYINKKGINDELAQSIADNSISSLCLKMLMGLFGSRQLERYIIMKLKRNICSESSKCQHNGSNSCMLIIVCIGGE